MGSLVGSLAGVAIEWYWALAKTLALTGVDLDDVFDMINAWLAGDRPVWLRPATDPVTKLRYAVLWGRADTGRPLAVYARVQGRDLYVFGAAWLDADERQQFETWEATGP